MTATQGQEFWGGRLALASRTRRCADDGRRRRGLRSRRAGALVDDAGNPAYRRGARSRLDPRRHGGADAALGAQAARRPRPRRRGDGPRRTHAGRRAAGRRCPLARGGLRGARRGRRRPVRPAGLPHPLRPVGAHDPVLGTRGREARQGRLGSSGWCSSTNGSPSTRGRPTRSRSSSSATCRATAPPAPPTSRGGRACRSAWPGRRWRAPAIASLPSRWAARRCTSPRLRLARTRGPRGSFVLPPFEEYFISYADRTRVCAPELLSAIGPGINGIVKPVIVADGEIVGTWATPKVSDIAGSLPPARLFRAARCRRRTSPRRSRVTPRSRHPDSPTVTTRICRAASRRSPRANRARCGASRGSSPRPLVRGRRAPARPPGRRRGARAHR